MSRSLSILIAALMLLAAVPCGAKMIQKPVATKALPGDPNPAALAPAVTKSFMSKLVGQRGLPGDPNPTYKKKPAALPNPMPRPLSPRRAPRGSKFQVR